MQSGDLFVFLSREHKRAKVLHFDGTGPIVWAKRLERRFAPLYRKSRRGGCRQVRRSSAASYLGIIHDPLVVEGLPVEHPADHAIACVLDEVHISADAGAKDHG